MRQKREEHFCKRDTLPIPANGMEPYMPGRSRLFPSRYSASPSTTPTPPPTNGFSSPGSSPSNTVSRTIPTTIQINRPYVNNLNNGNLATTSSATSVNNPTLTTTVPISKRPTNSSLSSLGIGTGKIQLIFLNPTSTCSFAVAILFLKVKEIPFRSCSQKGNNLNDNAA